MLMNPKTIRIDLLDQDTVWKKAIIEESPNILFELGRSLLFFKMQEVDFTKPGHTLKEGSILSEESEEPPKVFRHVLCLSENGACQASVGTISCQIPGFSS